MKPPDKAILRMVSKSPGRNDQGGSLVIGQPESSGPVCSANAIVGRQVFLLQQQFLVDTRPVTNDRMRAQ